jgi:hypothetical protein
VGRFILKTSKKPPSKTKNQDKMQKAIFTGQQ